jgi:hypothetical protein
MPALVLFKRRWHIAADDVPLVAAPAALFHLLWCAVLGLGLWLLRRPPECHEGGQYFTCVRGLLGCFASACLLELAMVAEGLKGGCTGVSTHVECGWMNGCWN